MTLDNTNISFLNILLIEDNNIDVEVFERALDKHGQFPFKLHTANTGAAAKEVLQSKTPVDIIFLDLYLPDEDGLSLLKFIRTVRKNTPVIVVSGKDSTTERIIALEIGADDYVTKPYETRELYARMKSVMRRTQPKSKKTDDTQSKEDRLDGIRFDQWIMDQKRYDVFSAQGKPAGLTAMEYKTLVLLIKNKMRVLSRSQLNDIKGDGGYESYERSIDALISRLRRKLGDEPSDPQIIKTVRGFGYMFCSDVQSQDNKEAQKETKKTKQ